MAAWQGIYASGAGFAPIAQGIKDIGASFRDARERQEAEELFARLAPMMQPQQAPTAAFSPPQAATTSLEPPGNFPRSLIKTESGGRWNAQNDATGAGGMKGHFGRLQFGQARLQEAAAAGAIPQGTTPQAFMASPEMQQRAEQWHFADIDNFIRERGLDRVIGQNIGGAPVTLDGMRAVAHLGGKEGLRKFVETGGRYNPSDVNGSSLLSYLARHAGQGQQNPLAGVQPMQSAGQQPVQVAQAPQAPQIDMATLAAMARNRYTAPIAQQVLSKQLGRDPMQQQMQALQIQQLQQALTGGTPQQQAMAAEQLRQIQLANQASQQALSSGMTRDLPPEVREYQFYSQQERAAGREPDPFVKWSRDNRAASRAQTNVNVGGGSDKQIFDTMKESADDARAASTGLAAISEARRAVEGGGIFGAGADQRLAIGKLATALGFDGTKVTNTETFRSAIAPQVAAMLKSTVGSAQISNADREFAEKAAGGSIALDESTIRRLLAIMERGNIARIESHSQRMGQVYPEADTKFARERALFGVQAPQPSQAPATNQIREGATATNPKTGQKIRFTNGQWVPVQ